MKPQLFYRIADPGGAAARRLVMERDLLRDFQFRNVHYDEVMADLARLHAAAGRTGDPMLPALYDSTTLFEGEPDVLAAIGRMTPTPANLTNGPTNGPTD